MCVPVPCEVCVATPAKMFKVVPSEVYGLMLVRVGLAPGVCE